MNYSAHYSVLICKAKNRCIPSSEFTEKHHIVPRCLGGTDEKSNIVCLYPEEHYTAHLLLAKIHNIRSLWFAANMMTVGEKRNNKAYGWLKRKAAEAQSAARIEYFSKEENRKRLSENKKLRNASDPEKVKRDLVKMHAKHRTEEFRNNARATIKQKWEDADYRNRMVAARNAKRINSPDEWAEICKRRGEKIKEGKAKAKAERLNP